MRLLKTITDSDFEGGAPEYLGAVSRCASRGVLVDRESNVAMMYMAKMGAYKLPGGGIGEGEHPRAAFLREIREETGCEAEIVRELGRIEEHKNKNGFMQLSYCYIAEARGSGAASLTESEVRLGMAVEWMAPGQALEALDRAARSCREYGMKFMLLRDRTIVERALPLLRKW